MSQDRSLKFAGIGVALVAAALYVSPPAALQAFLGTDEAPTTGPVVDPPAPQEVASSGIVNPLSTMKSDDFAEVVTRPLFNPDRAAAPAQTEPPPDTTPPPEQPPDPQPEVTAADFDLLAIAGQEEARVALVRFKKTNQLFHVRKDQYVNDWKVADVGARDASLQNGDTTFTIKLFDGSHKAAPPPPPAAGDMGNPQAGKPGGVATDPGIAPVDGQADVPVDAPPEAGMDQAPPSDQAPDASADTPPEATDVQPQ